MRLLPALLLAACTADDPETTPTDTGTPLPVDPGVATWVPDTFPPTDPARIVFLGDSITAGYGIPQEQNTYPSLLERNNDQKYPERAGDDLVARFGDLEALNVARDGATTTSLIAGQLPAVEAAWGDVVTGQTLVVITIGGNDLTDALFSGGDPDEAADTIVANLEQIVDFFHDPARFPDGSFVSITNVYEPTDGTGQVEECFFGLDLSSVIPTFERLAADSLALAQDQGWAWVDLRGHFLGHGFRHDEQGPWTDEADPTLWFQDDCIHPNSRGHHEIRRLFLAALDARPLLLE